MSRWTGPATRLALCGGAGAAAVILALPAVSGAQWAETGAALREVGVGELALLVALWAAGLWVHTPSLTAALPGLSHGRALLLNLSGSFVSNLLPLGGAAGTVVNWRMARTWGFDGAAFARWAVLTNLADTVVKVALPGLVLCWVVQSGTVSGGVMGAAAAVGTVVLGVLVLGVGLAARDDRPVRWAGGRADAVVARIPWVPRAPEGYGERAAAFRRDSASLVRAGWGRMLGGKLAYAALQAVLLWACLQAVGGHVAPVVVACAYAVERVLSMLVLTPGAVGAVEVGMVGVLGTLGTAPAAAVAGVLVYRALVVGMEVPVGGLALLGWCVQRRQAGLGWRLPAEHDAPVPVPLGAANTTVQPAKMVISGR